MVSRGRRVALCSAAATRTATSSATAVLASPFNCAAPQWPAQRAAVSDQGDGTYLVRFRPQLATEHEVHAWLRRRAPLSAGGDTAVEAPPLPLGGSPTC